MTDVAVIGAGLAGCTAARHLSEIANIKVYEKSKRSGGRIATRFSCEHQFDHGAQFFTARSSAFKDFLAPLVWTWDVLQDGTDALLSMMVLNSFAKRSGAAHRRIG